MKQLYFFLLKMRVKLNDLEMKKYKYNLCTSDYHTPPRMFIIDKEMKKLLEIDRESDL